MQGDFSWSWILNSDWRFYNLCGSYLQSHSELYHDLWRYNLESGNWLFISFEYSFLKDRGCIWNQELFVSFNRAIFVWPWNENAQTKQKQQTNGNRVIWLVYRTDINVRGFWLAKRTLGWKNFMTENFLENNRYFALTSYCNTIGQSNNAFSILGFSLAGKQRGHVLIFSSIGW